MYRMDLRKRAAQGKLSTPRPWIGTLCKVHMEAFGGRREAFTAELLCSADVIVAGLMQLRSLPRARRRRFDARR
jgi:hypothetical protein